jgi:uncharacterized protein
MDKEKFAEKFLKMKALLDDNHEFPCEYSFRFVVKTHLQDELISIMGTEAVNSRAGKNKNYYSLTFLIRVDSSDHVVDIYTRASVVEGIISL